MELIRGKELAQKILDQITEHPETHDQDTWVNSSGECGTTYCIAGWAVALNALESDSSPRLDVTRARLSRELSIRFPTWSLLAEELLGLGDAEAEELFFADTEEAPAKLAELFDLDYSPES